MRRRFIIRCVFLSEGGWREDDWRSGGGWEGQERMCLIGGSSREDLNLWRMVMVVVAVVLLLRLRLSVFGGKLSSAFVVVVVLVLCAT
jgi:hypothetical protein